MLPLWGLFVATIGLLWFLNKSKKNGENGLKEIPGPKGLPWIGSLFSLGKYPNDQMCKWTKEYGDIFQIKLAGKNFVVISDPKYCKEIFSDSQYTGRLSLPEFEIYPDTPGLGVFSSEGEKWEVHRRFLLRQLRDFGFGKTSMEASILEEVRGVIKMYKTKLGQPVTRIRETLRLAVVNALWAILSSKRFDQSDTKLLNLANNTSEAFNEVLEKGSILLFAPWIRHIIPKMSGYEAMREILDANRAFMEESIKEHKDNFKEDDLKDFMDVYLAEMKKHENDPQSHFYGEVAERQLASMCLDMFFAGSDTTAITTAWTSLYLCKFPHVQKRFQEEISEITGDLRNVLLTDRPNMPYTNALIDEILRFSSIVPDGVQHRALTDKIFHGYSIPRDTYVQPNLYFIHHSPKIWGDPENFRPERFLKDGKYSRNENLQPFQVGRRQCLGESLARDNIFLFLTNLFQQFSMTFDPTKPEPGFEAEVGFLRAPKPYFVILSDRLSKNIPS